MTALTVIRDTPNAGVYVGGFNIAPDVVLILAGSYGEAWDLMCEHFAENGWLARVDVDEDDPDSTNDLDWVDGFGWANTHDLVLRVVRPSAFD